MRKDMGKLVFVLSKGARVIQLILNGLNFWQDLQGLKHIDILG